MWLHFFLCHMHGVYSVSWHDTVSWEGSWPAPPSFNLGLQKTHTCTLHSNDSTGCLLRARHSQLHEVRGDAEGTWQTTWDAYFVCGVGVEQQFQCHASLSFSLLGWVAFNHPCYLKNTASLVTAEHLLCTATNSVGDFIPLCRKLLSDIFYLALECFIQQKVADFFFFFATYSVDMIYCAN